VSLLNNVSTFLSGKHRRTKILCHFNHFFGKASGFVGRSTTGTLEDRSELVQTALLRIRALPFDMDIRVCGFPEFSLLPIDLDLSEIREAQHIVYASIERMFNALDDYDYFLNIEDDILVADEVIEACIAFNASSTLNEVYLPNRMERRADGSCYCVDMLAIPGWNGALHRIFRNTTLGIANNPHSGLFFLSRKQMHYAASRVNLSRRKIVVGGFMASAYANLHAPFLLWRAQSDLLAHHIIHLDKWLQSPAEETRSPDTSLCISNAGSGRPDPVGHQPLGHVDVITMEGTFVKFQGWAITETGDPAGEFLLRFDSNERTKQDFHLARIDRPDVVSVHPHAQQGCGFELAFPVHTLFALQKGLDAERVVFGFRAEASDTFSIIQGGAMTQALQSIVAALPEIPSEPFMPKPVADRLVELMLQANCYLEYGTGGTTVKAVNFEIPNVFAVESDALWLEAIRYKIGQFVSTSECHLIHVDVGPTREWGYPTSEAHWRDYPRYALDIWGVCQAKNVAPDLILIAGRFRVACFLASILFGKPGCRIIIDDYLIRPHYADVEQFIVPERIIDRAAEFIIPHELSRRNQVWHTLLTAVSDPR
jgi:hypothetical protein